ncbi:MAG: energy transducer TonB [Acidobacteriota bacterium]
MLITAKKILLKMIVIVFASAAGIFAQGNSLKLLSTTGEIFTLLFPADLRIETVFGAGATEYAAELSTCRVSITSEPARENDLQANYLRAAISRSPTIKKIKMGTLPGFEYYTFTDGYFTRSYFFATQDRHYTLYGCGRGGHDPLIDEVFASLKIVGKPAPGNIAHAEIIDNGNPVEPGLGTGPKKPEATPTPAPPVTYDIKPLKILSKPRAPLTEEARAAGIQGAVRLKVEFRSDRTIGKISVVTGFPYGLTEIAVQAARKIIFDPGTRNGVPVTMTKIIEYALSIY